MTGHPWLHGQVSPSLWEIMEIEAIANTCSRNVMGSSPTQPTWRVQQPWNYHKFSCCSYLQWRPKATTDCCSERKEVEHQGWLTCIHGCIVLHTSMDNSRQPQHVNILPQHTFQFMGCSLMALLSTNNCYRTSMFGAWMHPIFTNHIFKPVTTNCMQRSGSETRLVLDILLVHKSV